MSQFYNKYKHLFINQEKQKSAAKSYLKPYMKQMKNRANSLSFAQKRSTENNNFSSNRFETEILPELKKLNKQAENHRIVSEISVPPLVYSPQINNKYKNKQKCPAQNYFTYLTPQVTTKKSQKFRQNYYKHSRDDIRKFKSFQQFANPEDSNIFAKQSPQHQISARSAKIKTQPSISQNNYNFRLKMLPKIDNARLNYGYPQVNYGLLFSQYQKQNQFQLINRRLRDIRWLQKYYARGNLNSYRQALIRRNQSKKIIEQRRNKLKNMMQAEKKQYEKRLPIV